jgi:hypothetical protein
VFEHHFVASLLDLVLTLYEHICPAELRPCNRQWGSKQNRRIYRTKQLRRHTAFQMYGSCKPEAPWIRHVFALCVNGWTAQDFLSRERDPWHSAATD